MFSWRTGWAATVAGIVGALAATDTLPMLTAILTETIGAKAAHTAGLLVTLAAIVVAKLSHSTKPDA